MRRRSVCLSFVSLLALTGCKGQASPAEAAAHLKTSQELFAQKNYAKALDEVRASIRANPQSGDAHYLAAQIQQALGNQRGAFEEYVWAAAPDANNLKAQIKVAQILIDANRLDAALGRINGTIGSHPGDPEALALRALIEQRQGNEDKARGDAQAALARAPGQPTALAVLASDALTSRNGDKALALIATGLKVHPGDTSLLRLQAMALLAGGRKDDAIAVYQGLVAASPASVRDRAALADAEAQAGRPTEGEKALREGIVAAPDKAEMRTELIGFLDRYRGNAAADTALQEAVAANPQESAFDLLRAEHLLRGGHADEASEALQAAILRVPEGRARQAAQIGLARLDADQGDVTAARKLLDQVLSAQADNDEALLLRARLMLGTDESAHAIPDLLTVARQQPQNSAAFALLSDAYVAQGDYEKAADALKKVTYFQPADLAAALRLTNIDMKAGKPDLARAALADFNAHNPTSADGRVASVRLLLQQRDFAGAQSAIDGLRRLPRADQAVALLGAQLLEAKGEPDQAMAAYGRQLGADPSKPLDRDALQGYARNAIAAKQTERAIGVVATLAGRLEGSDQAAADLVLAGLNEATGKQDQLRAAVRAAMVAAPTEPAAYLQLAALQHDPRQATEQLNAGLAAGASAEPLLLARAAIEQQSEDKKAAIATYRDVLKVDPGSVAAANNYGSLVADADASKKGALADARHLVQRFAGSTDPAMLDTLAWLDYRLGDLPSAKALLMRAKADTSPDPQLRYHYGAVLLRLGDKDGGRSIIRAALAQPFTGRAEAERLMAD